MKWVVIDLRNISQKALRLSIIKLLYTIKMVQNIIFKIYTLFKILLKSFLFGLLFICKFSDTDIRQFLS